MGIQGLKTYIEQRCPGGTLSVNISDRVKKSLTDSGKSEASLAVDTNSCIHNWYKRTDKNGFTGGQWKEYQMTLQKFINDCKELNINLYFFFDGTTELGKKNEWYKRQESRISEIKTVFSYLDMGVIPTNPTMPPTIPYFTKYILSSLGEKVIYADGDADYDIMKFAVETPECIGVVANDTDYLAFPGSKPVFTPDCFHLENNEALMWHKPALLKTLGLEEDDMPVFACLMGNDLTADYSDRLRNFKRKLGGDWNQSVVSKLKSFKNRNGYNLNLFEKEVLGHCEDLIFSSVVKSYTLPNHKSPWLPSGNEKIGNESTRTNKFNCSEKLLKESKMHSHWIHEILKFGVQKALTSYENYIFEPQFVVYCYIRERMYGIILSEINSDKKVVEEWIGYKYDRNVELRHPVSMMYKGQQVKLLQLWEPDYPQIDKVHVFEQCLGLTGHTEALSKVAPNLPQNLIVSSYLLCYMAKNMTMITQKDLECLVECAIWCNDVSISFIRELPQIKPNARAVELASHYGRGLQVFLNANIVCGKPFKLESFIPTNTFDGLLFQTIFQEPMKFQKTSKSFRKSMMDLCSCKYSSLEPDKDLQKVTTDIEALNIRP